MTQGELEKLGLPVTAFFSELEMRIMEDIVRRIKLNGFSTASADWQITRLQQLGESEEDIKKWIQEALAVSDAEIERIFSDEVYEQYMGHRRGFTLFGMEQIPFEENIELQSLIDAVRKQTAGTFRDITGSLGFVRQSVSGHMAAAGLSQFYRETLDAAMYDIHSGIFDYNKVLTRTINDMTRSGLRWIDYESGYHSRVDVAARRAVMTGFRQVQGKINEQVAGRLGTDTYEVTYHAGARPTHQAWQGRVWTMRQLRDICGLGTVTGLNGANCYHDYLPFIPGVSERTYTDEQLEQMMKEENTPKVYNGREYTAYEALQQQRKMETAMRKTRQDIRLMEKGDADSTDIIIKRGRYAGQMQTYRDFSETMHLPQQMGRVYQDGLGRVGGGGRISGSSVEKVVKADTIKVGKQLSLSELKDFEDWQNEYYELNRGLVLSKENFPGISTYSGGAYQGINAVERFERGSAEYDRYDKSYRGIEQFRSVSHKISEEISQFRNPCDLQVHRSVGEVSYITGKTSSVEDMISTVGKVYVEKGFTSTTVCSDTTLPFGGTSGTKTKLEIFVPKEVRGAYIYKISDSPAEFEFLIDKNTAFRVVDAGVREIERENWKGKLIKEQERYMKLEVLADGKS